jgi:eukaryotic-like serine/threonine-protein kinase
VTLAAGSRLGPYEIVAPLGAGGMGEVYKARDTRLERTVAVKVLPSHLSASPESRQRFEREAKTISQLSHPHICALHDVGREGEVEYLVMEYLEGETLADRLLKGSLPLEQTLRYGIQIADALDKAHRQGIVHRDLKPGNVMLTKSGVKLLDFGLAKAVARGSSTIDLTTLPTQAAPVTREGSLLGTVQYMAPEQLEGREADARSDIFAFGCLVHEMMTGRKAFSGATQASLISSILRDEPIVVSQVEPTSPPALDRIVRKCLSKDPEDRWQNAGDLASELAWIGEGSSAAGMTAPVVTRRAGGSRLPWIIAAAGLAALVASLLFNRREVELRRTMRFSIAPPEKSSFICVPEAITVALSPDGTRLAGVSYSEGKTSLWVRALDSLNAKELAGTEGAVSPFWSPDGRSIAFFARSKLKKVAAAGGPPQDLCDSPTGSAGTWGKDGTILFTEFGSGRQGIYSVSSEGGTPSQVIAPNGVKALNWPVFLPDGKHFLFVNGSSGAVGERRTISVGSVGSRETRALFPAESRAVYCPAGYLFFVRDGALLAESFDASALRSRGDPITVADDVWLFRPTGNAAFSVSEKGDVAYLTALQNSQVVWRDRTGRKVGVAAPPTAFGRMRLSPDGSRIAVQVADPRKGSRDIWIYDDRGLAQRLTADPSDAVAPIWSPDGARIAFGSAREGPPDVYVKPANGSGDEQALLREKGVQLPLDWSPDGRVILYDDYSPSRSPARQVWGLSLTGGEFRHAPLLRTRFTTSQARYSPDGKWVAFMSEETGRREVYVVSSDGSGPVRRLSASGGSLPRWGAGGKELLYLAENGDLVSLAMPLGGAAPPTSTSILFNADPPPAEFDVPRDGQRLLFLEGGHGDIPRSADLTVVSNWLGEVAKK